MAILEGMASSLPWVAPSVGAIPLAIHDGQNGILIPPENVDVLANSMARMMRDSEERGRTGAAAHRLTKSEFSAERMSEDYLGVYTCVANQARAYGVAR